MSGIIEIPLGLVQGQICGDDGYRRVFGDFPRTICLRTNHYNRINNELLGSVSEELSLINFKENFNNTSDLILRLEQENFFPKSIAHLAMIKDLVPSHFRRKLAHIEACDPRSFMVDSSGDSYVPRIECYQGSFFLDCVWDELYRDKRTWYLVGKTS